jgi:hypothetical protein
LQPLRPWPGRLLPVLAAALLAGPGAARAQSVSDEASFRAI